MNHLNGFKISSGGIFGFLWDLRSEYVVGV